MLAVSLFLLFLSDALHYSYAANGSGRFLEQPPRALDIPWAYAVLKHLRGVKFPIQDSQVLKEKLKGVKIKTHPAEEVVDKLPYPIRTPAILLHEIKLAISALEEQK